MTKAYALLKLLEHGHLSLDQILHITLWRRDDCIATIEELRGLGQIVTVRGSFRLATLPDIRLSDLLARTVEEGNCLLWTGHATQEKYPQWRIKNINRPARRIVYETLHGPIRRGLQVGVNCGCELCVHPDHLVARPKKVAMRIGPMTRARRLNIAMSRRANSKLNMDIVRQIRASDEPGPVIEERYGLKAGYASRIRLGIVWRDHSSPFAGLGGRVAA